MDRTPEKKQKDLKNTARLLAMITQFGLNMLVPMCMCFFAGRYLDRRFSTNWITVVLFFVGALAGFTNVYRMARKFTGDNSPSSVSLRLTASPREGEALDTEKDGDESKVG